MNPPDLNDWLSLYATKGVGAVRFRLLIKEFGSAGAVLKASAEELARLPRLDAKTIKAITTQNNTEFVEKQLQLIEKHHVQVITYQDDEYPSRLNQIYDPPPLLFVRGQVEAIKQPAIGIVGSRSASGYGRRVTKQLAMEIVQQKMVVISGLARGIDRIAHEGALEAGGQTVAVLGNGVDVIYPHEHKALMSKILENGAIVSEFFMGVQPARENFPRRNRIISGLSQGILVTEARKGSGALITANYALEQGREVFAVPGPINYASNKGSHELIKTGAKLVEDVNDILEELNLTSHPIPIIPPNTESSIPRPPLSAEEEAVYNHLSIDPIHIDILAEITNQPTHHLLGILLSLELKGVVRALAGTRYVAV